MSQHHQTTHDRKLHKWQQPSRNQAENLENRAIAIDFVRKVIARDGSFLYEKLDGTKIRISRFLATIPF